MANTPAVLVFAEQDGGTLAGVGLELMSKGRELADTLGGELTAAVLGAEIEALPRELIA